jgi:hypothetical protein
LSAPLQPSQLPSFFLPGKLNISNQKYSFEKMTLQGIPWNLKCHHQKIESYHELPKDYFTFVNLKIK